MAISRWFTYKEWWCSIVILVYQRVDSKTGLKFRDQMIGDISAAFRNYQATKTFDCGDSSQFFIPQFSSNGQSPQ